MKHRSMRLQYRCARRPCFLFVELSGERGEQKTQQSYLSCPVISMVLKVIAAVELNLRSLSLRLCENLTRPWRVVNYSLTN
jgi:hypothetical protein